MERGERRGEPFIEARQNLSLPVRSVTFGTVKLVIWSAVHLTSRDGIGLKFSYRAPVFTLSATDSALHFDGSDP